jgi:hypothetical protein
MTPKGRHTLWASTPSGRTPRFIEPWAVASKGPELTRLEKTYLDTLAAVDAFEARKAQATKSGTLTATGLKNDALQYAASKSVPALLRAKLAVEQARAALAERRARLTLKSSDPSDLAAQQRRLWKIEAFNRLPDSTRNAITADVSTMDETKIFYGHARLHFFPQVYRWPTIP